MAFLDLSAERTSAAPPRRIEAASRSIAGDSALAPARKRRALVRATGLVGLAMAGLLACAVTGASAIAQAAYPTRMITLIVPFAAGGPTDVVARIVGERVSQTLRQHVVIENVVGAGGTTAATRTMRAAPDGYTIMMGHMGTHGAAVALYPKLAYEPTRDFAPIGMVAGMPVLILARKGIPAHDLADFIAYVKLHAADLTMAHAGLASVSQVTCQMFNSLLDVSPKEAAFQGSGPAMEALVAGRVDYMCDQIVTVVPQANAHSIRVYAVGSPARSAALPDVPTAREAGLPQFDVSAWNALFAPRSTPQPVIARLNSALVEALDDPAVRRRLTGLGGDIPDQAGRSPEALAALVKSEVAKWQRILKPAAAKY